MKHFIAVSLLAVLPLCAAEKKSPAPIQKTEATVVIGGQVRRPGPVSYSKELTIFAAIQGGGGPTEFGAMKRVKVIRDGKVLNFDLTKDEQKSALALKNDTIEIPQKNVFGR